MCEVAPEMFQNRARKHIGIENAQWKLENGDRRLVNGSEKLENGDQNLENGTRRPVPGEVAPSIRRCGWHLPEGPGDPRAQYINRLALTCQLN